uniref:Guanylate kinase-like domain-containing protein n=1 Tax=Strigamia maritima TaxID=126957 RepID=T1J6S1_STRMM
MNRLVDEFPHLIAHSVSHTTRASRPNEIDGRDYHFVDDAMMQAIIRSGQLLEYMTFVGNTYATTKSTVDDILKSGKICLLTVDINGCDVIRKTYKGAKLVFIMPPSKND